MDQSTARREPSAAEAAREIIRISLKASLATLEEGTGFPYASLVTVALEPDGAPILLLSDLALHTRNLKSDSRATLLFDASDEGGDPLAGGRVSVMGRMLRLDGGAASSQSAQRFIARQPAAEMYAGFADFAFWRMTVERAHYIGGFGRIVDLCADKLLGDVSQAEALITAEREIVEHMNADHSDAVELYATVLCGAGAGPWRMTGIDPAGIDMVNGNCGARLNFKDQITDPDAARAELVRLVKFARSQT